MSLALFDLDQTLIPYDTQALFCQHILKRHPLRRAYLLAFLPVLPFAAVRLIGERGLKRVFSQLPLWHDEIAGGAGSERVRGRDRPAADLSIGA